MTQLRRIGLLTPRQILNRILDSPQLVGAVRDLSGPILGRLIDRVGLEDAAELVALATTQQLETVFDEDLWQVRHDGWEEQFNPRRFALWLHAFLEAGEGAVVTRLVELPLELVTLAVQRLILVVNIDTLAVDMSNSWEESERDQMEKALECCLYEEWEEFRLISRDDTAWDDINQALFALDREHHQLLRRILERCEAMSSEWIDDNGGLYAVLTSDEMLENDVRAARDDRRAEKGYVSPADARAFLELAKSRAGDIAVRDPITNAYFRELSKAQPKSTKPNPSRVQKPSNSSHQDDLLRLIDQACVVAPSRPKPALGNARKGRAALPGMVSAKAKAKPADGLAEVAPRWLDRALAVLRDTEPVRYAERMEELSFLANVLMADPQNQRQKLRPIEALESALTTVNRGLEQAIGDTSGHSTAALLDAACAVLISTSADRLFRLGYGAGGSVGGGSDGKRKRLPV